MAAMTIRYLPRVPVMNCDMNLSSISVDIHTPVGRGTNRA
jgi:hypothetical protein